MASDHGQTAGLPLGARNQVLREAARSTLGLNADGDLSPVKADEVRPRFPTRPSGMSQISIVMNESSNPEEVMSKDLCLRLTKKEAQRTFLRWV
ncbi:hypothetical protein GCM10009608_33670 [Pseudonocardia alaniniphila]